mmetsp:Transcript_13134/g.28385  ORF Transcript_13134/g.28385 Transcript_13134/m.28385 type:complete len:115 (+) Transcript_13134:2304-2648(+)
MQGRWNSDWSPSISNVACDFETALSRRRLLLPCRTRPKSAGSSICFFSYCTSFRMMYFAANPRIIPKGIEFEPDPSHEEQLTLPCLDLFGHLLHSVNVNPAAAGVGGALALRLR